MADPIEGDVPDVINSVEPLGDVPAKAEKFRALAVKHGYDVEMLWGRGRLKARRKDEHGEMPEVIETYTTVSVRASRAGRPRVVGIWTTDDEFFSGGIGSPFGMGKGIRMLEAEIKRRDDGDEEVAPKPTTRRAPKSDLVVNKAATISADGVYRYWLGRAWSSEGGLLTFVMLNPSTADASLDDPTIKRCMAFAQRDGFGGISVLNLYAYRSSTPKALLTAEDPIGPDNDDYLRRALRQQVEQGNPVIAAWGNNAKPGRVAWVRALAESNVDWRCLGLTQDGHPKHPLARGKHRIADDQPLVVFP